MTCVSTTTASASPVPLSRMLSVRIRRSRWGAPFLLGRMELCGRFYRDHVVPVFREPHRVSSRARPHVENATGAMREKIENRGVDLLA